MTAKLGIRDQSHRGEEEENSESCVRVLTEKIAADCLCLLGNTYLGDSYAYLKLDARDQQLCNIDIIRCYQYVQFINLDNNLLNNFQLKVLEKLPCIIVLEINNNRLESTAIPKLPFLQALTMKNNSIHQVTLFDHENLGFVDLEENQIREIPEDTFVKCPALLKLSVMKNLLSSTAGIHCESLVFLYLQENAISKVEGLDRLVNLEVLNLRGNDIRRLDRSSFPSSMYKLSYLNLRDNKLHRIKDFRRLKHLPSLTTLVCFRNDYDKHTDFEVRGPILAHLKRLRRLNKREVTLEERQELGDEDSSSTASSELLDDVQSFIEEEVAENGAYDDGVDFASDVSWKLGE